MKCLVIGGGNVVFGNLKSTPNKTNHYYWLKKLNIPIIGILEVSKKRRIEISKIYDIPIFKNLEEIKNCFYDTVLICSPDNTHEFYLDFFLNQKQSKIIICEKPLITSASNPSMWIRAYNKKNKKLYLNLTRRFLNDYKFLTMSKKINNLQSITINYTKGFFHNGIHALDLIIPFLDQKYYFIKTNAVNDYIETDTTISGMLWNDKIKVFINGMNDKHFSNFEIDFYFKDKRYRFYRSGLFVEKFKVQNDNIYKGYRELFTTEKIKTNILDSMKFLYKDIITQQYKMKLKESDGKRLDNVHKLVLLMQEAEIGVIGKSC